jgi:3'-phosphoadenosine 5'-phosphosulfate sulfotransferase (PAPS reductase)/FAD synthetase
LKRVEAYLQRPIVYLNPNRGFDHWLDMYNGMLPSAQVRWCTRKLKIEPFETYVGNDPVWNYIGIRAEEARKAYISTKPTITAIYPFKEHGMVLSDIERILEESGIGLPDYYEWRTRSGCYFCFFQRTGEWIGLKERHPEQYEEAKAYERKNGGDAYTWRDRESLSALEQPERMAQARREHQQRLEDEKRRRPGRTLIDLQAAALDAEDDEVGCNICHL